MTYVLEKLRECVKVECSPFPNSSGWTVRVSAGVFTTELSFWELAQNNTLPVIFVSAYSTRKYSDFCITITRHTRKLHLSGSISSTTLSNGLSLCRLKRRGC